MAKLGSILFGSSAEDLYSEDKATLDLFRYSVVEGMESQRCRLFIASQFSRITLLLIFFCFKNIFILFQ
jgi:hypothetical protein